MPNVITYQYFRGSLNLPQAANALGQTLLTQYITQFENEFLEMALGYELAQGLLTNIASNDPKWKDLRDGVEFTGNNGRLKKWEGLKNETTYVSPIANFVYYQFVKSGITEMAEIGAVQPKGENSDRVYPMLKLVDAWNRMVDMVRKLHEFIRLDPDLYPEFNNYPYSNYWGVRKKINQFGI